MNFRGRRLLTADFACRLVCKAEIAERRAGEEARRREVAVRGGRWIADFAQRVGRCTAAAARAHVKRR